jgi:hypothetical protein
LGLGGWLVGQRYLLGVALSAALPKLLLAVTLTLFGFGMVCFAVLTELLSELHYDDKRPYRIKRVVDG